MVFDCSARTMGVSLNDHLRFANVLSELDWDDEIPDCAVKWRAWLMSLPGLEKLEIPRFFKSATLQIVRNKEMHVFTDASTTGYSCVVSLKMSDDDGQTHVTFVTGKSRLAPHKHVTILRLALTAAVVGIRLANLMQS